MTDDTAAPDWFELGAEAEDAGFGLNEIPAVVVAAGPEAVAEWRRGWLLSDEVSWGTP